MSQSVDVVDVYVGLGSNVGRRLHHLSQGVKDLVDIALPGSIRCSSLYESDPVGYLNQDSFLNMAASFKTRLSAHDVLEKLLKIEVARGRVRTIRNGPRTLDLDLLIYGNSRISDTRLQVPHPRITERAFVLCPLRDLDPDLLLEDGQRAGPAAEDAAQRGGIQYVGRFW